jgi:hypothetical protein
MIIAMAGSCQGRQLSAIKSQTLNLKPLLPRYAAFINAGSIKFPPSDDQFAYYRGAGDFVYLWKNVMGLNSFFTWFKIFKYFSHIPFMARLVKVMAAAAEDCIAFLICFFVVYFGFVLAFFLSVSVMLYLFAFRNARRVCVGVSEKVNSRHAHTKLSPALYISTYVWMHVLTSSYFHILFLH